MDKKVYLGIRQKLNLDKNEKMLFVHLVQDAALFALTLFIFEATKNPFLKIVSPFIMAIIIFRNFSLMHDAVHGAASKNKYLNEVIGIWSGAISLLPYESWKQVHLQHHYWSGNVDKDPVMLLVKNFKKFHPVLRFLLNFFWKLWVPFIAFMQYGVFWLQSSRLYFKNLKNIKNGISLIVPLLIWTTIAFVVPKGFILFVFAPAVVMYLLMAEVVNLPHHMELPHVYGEKRILIWEQYGTVRSCYYPSWLARFVALNFNYHIEHHLYPDVPWYHLEKINKELRTVLKDDYNYDPQFAWIIKNRKKSLEYVLSSQPLPQKQAASSISELMI